MATLVLLSWLASRVVGNNKVVVNKTLVARQLVVVMAEKLVLFKQRLMRSLLRPFKLLHWELQQLDLG